MSSDDKLKARVDELESRLEAQQEVISELMPSRRSFLAGAAGLGIGAVGMSAASGSAAAESVGQIGTADEQVDAYIHSMLSDVDYEGNNINNFGTASGDALDVSTVESDVDHDGNDINNFGTATGEALEADNINSKRQSSDYHFAGSYDGEDLSSRLSNAINAATNGDTVYLENRTYSSFPDIDKRLTFIGTDTSGIGQGTGIDSSFSVDEFCAFRQIRLNSTMTFNADRCSFVDGWIRGEIVVDGDNCIVSNCFGLVGDGVTFNSETSDGVVDTCTSMTVTDNGTNVVGDIS